MKRLPVILASIAGVTIVVLACIYWFAFKRTPGSTVDRVSYTIGAQFGKSLVQQNLKLDSAMVARGIRDAIDGEALPLTEKEMEEAMVQLNEQRKKDMNEEAEKNRVTADEFLSRNRVAEGVKETKSGLQYKVIVEGHGISPKPDDIVVMNYKGTLIDGKEFDSSLKRGVPVELPVKGLMSGWREGIQLMKMGGKSIIYVPPQLAYGDRPRQFIPANSVLIFETELVLVKPAPKK